MKWTFSVIERNLNSGKLRYCDFFGNYSDAVMKSDCLNNFKGDFPVRYFVRKIDLNEGFKPLFEEDVLPYLSW